MRAPTNCIGTIGRLRSRRVLLLLSGIVMLSVADLLLTLNHLTTIGMLEGNPIAVYLIRSTDSAWALTAYKTASVSVCVVLLFRLRRCVQGEVGAWCGMAILTVLSFMWGTYASHFEDPDQVEMARSGMYGSSWVVLADP